MDRSERQRLRRLANDAVIDLFGVDNRESKLALALEKCVDELDIIATECDQCRYCDVHGEVEDDTIAVDPNEVLRIHGELKKQMQAFKDLHAKFSGAVAESDIDDLVEELASQIEEAESYVDELEVGVLP